jgi:hypothetical protein
MRKCTLNASIELSKLSRQSLQNSEVSNLICKVNKSSMTHFTHTLRFFRRVEGRPYDRERRYHDDDDKNSTASLGRGLEARASGAEP